MSKLTLIDFIILTALLGIGLSRGEPSDVMCIVVFIIFCIIRFVFWIAQRGKK
jgi:hypothetical protein